MRHAIGSLLGLALASLGGGALARPLRDPNPEFDALLGRLDRPRAAPRPRGPVVHAPAAPEPQGKRAKRRARGKLKEKR